MEYIKAVHSSCYIMIGHAHGEKMYSLQYSIGSSDACSSKVIPENDNQQVFHTKVEKRPEQVVFGYSV